MRDLASLGRAAPWFSAAGADGDVVVCSRVRLSRNLADFPYPQPPGRGTGRTDGTGVTGGADQASQVVSRAIRDELMPDILDTDTMDLRPHDLPVPAIGILAERRLLSEPLPRRLFVAGDESVDLGVGAMDHLRIVARTPGSGVGPAFEHARMIDRTLESVLHYAVSFDLGYLSAQLSNVGTALRASVLLHLPALSATARLADASGTIGAPDFALVPDEQLNAPKQEPVVFRLANRRTIGLEEEAIVSKLEDHVRALVHYERIAREELVASRGEQLADSAYRALGVLRCARLLGADEALTLLSRLRFGIAAGLVSGVPVETVTSLFFLSRDGHVGIAAQEKARPVDQGEENLQAERAALMRTALSG